LDHLGHSFYLDIANNKIASYFVFPFYSNINVKIDLISSRNNVWFLRIATVVQC